MKTWDVVIIGAGVIGLSLALELRRARRSVLLLEKQQPGREASWAAGGMLADSETGPDAALAVLARASAAMYPEFVHRLQDESGIKVDLREQGTIRFYDEHEQSVSGTPLGEEDLRRLEPQLEFAGLAVLVEERCLDPRLLMEALVGTAKHLGVDMASGSAVTSVELQGGRAAAAVTSKSRYPANIVVNCAGAWAQGVGPVMIPAKPVKGQMLAVTPATVKHVIRGNGVYLIPRSNGRLVIGATLEEVGFDKRVVPETIQRMHQAAAILVPNLGEARILEDWAGLRPGTPDGLPIMGATRVEGYFVSTGHYRDGILLAPVAAKVMAEAIGGKEVSTDLTPFSAARFAN